MGFKNWTDEELNSLEESWGIYSLPTISKRLGRTEQAIKQKALKIGLGNPVDNYGGFTLHALSKYLKVDYKRINNWVERYDFPAKSKKFTSEKRIQVVKEKDFWKWLEANKQMVDFSKIEPNSFGKEPDWFRAKRDADFIKARKVKKSSESAWTTEEDNILKGMLSAFIYTYSDITSRLNRSQGAIKTRIRNLGLPARPVRDMSYLDDVVFTEESTRNKRILWTDEDIERLHVLASGYQNNIVEVAVALGRTVQATKAKIMALGMEVHLKEYKVPTKDGKFVKDPLRTQLPERRKSWTEEESQQLIEMCKNQQTVVEISKEIGRSICSIKNRMRKLNITARPMDEYTTEQVKLIETLIMKGHCLEDIGERVERSAMGVRGKLERMGYKFKNGVPIPPTEPISHETYFNKILKKQLS